MLSYVVNDEAARTNGFAVVKFLHTRVSPNAFPVITRRIQFSQMSTQNNAVYQQGNILAHILSKYFAQDCR